MITTDEKTKKYCPQCGAKLITTKHHDFDGFDSYTGKKLYKDYIAYKCPNGSWLDRHISELTGEKPLSWD